MKMRLLNLDRSRDRLAMFRARNPHATDFVRIAAVDGRMTDRGRLQASDVIAPDLQYTDGALGCALSHLTQWRDAIQQNIPLTIVEDDAVLCANFHDEVTRVIARLPSDWEYIMWGYNFDAPLTYQLSSNLSSCTAIFDQTELRRNLPQFSQTDITTVLSKLAKGFGTVAYSVSPRGAKRLLQFCMPLRPMETSYPGLPHKVANTGIDTMMANVWPSMSAFVAVPPLVVTANNATASTVQERSRLDPADGVDPFPAEVLIDICEKIAGSDPFVIGVRQSSDARLATKSLHARGWSGFDIAAESSVLVQALRDGHVPSNIDLLYVGPKCDVVSAFSDLIAEFSPKLIILPPELSVMARDIRWSDNVDTNEDGPAFIPSHAAAARVAGYSLRVLRDTPAHIVLIRDDVSARSDLPHTSRGPVPPVDPRAVRLWH